MDLGSSPHTRGAPAVFLDRAHSRGIIPAYAGSTLEARVSIAFSQDHPRIRGEHSAKAAETTCSPGSSPHTRGARAGEFRIRRLGGGIIPAYAGSTRGGNVEMTSRSGSSPHTRGARRGISRSGPCSRIIPAYAGSTSRAWRCWRSRTDHPRIRGEHTIDDRRRILTNGSSPHTRGARRPDR